LLTLGAQSYTDAPDRKRSGRSSVVTPSNRIPLVQNGTVDLECSTTTNTVARQQEVEFAPTHFVASVGAAVKKSTGIHSFVELDGKAVATVTGSTSIQLLRGYRKSEKADITEISDKDTSETFLLLSSGRAAAMILDDVQLAGLIARSGSPGDGPAGPSPHLTPAGTAAPATACP
jgi:glutamate/aspartate transport system substrate-binding protein